MCQGPAPLSGGDGQGQGWTNPSGLFAPNAQTHSRHAGRRPHLHCQRGPAPACPSLERWPVAPHSCLRAGVGKLRPTFVKHRVLISLLSPRLHQARTRAPLRMAGSVPPCSLRCPKTSSQHRPALPPGPTPRGLQATTPDPAHVAGSEWGTADFHSRRKEMWKPRGLISLIQSFKEHPFKDRLPVAQGTCSHISAGLIQERMGTHWGTGASQHSQKSTRIFLSQVYTPFPLLISTHRSWASIVCAHPHRLLSSGSLP